ncbi:serine/Arginine-related protein 53 [Fopius arisanus]|uniref:Serine/Arginine-related protein 53 n=1 Tax=Fopius arisanus TaxID=64838 RepID=A0A0C9RCH2_9HYME|nr:PREDICTED: serine/Arginine-related protein 53-like [Fopius arisanus]
MVKPPRKMSKLVVSAIKHLQDAQGSTAKDILNYVVRECNAEPSMEKRLHTALKRGLEYGILKRLHGHYTLNTDPEMLQDPGPMERGRRRRRRRRRGRSGKSKSRRGRGRKKRRRGGRRKGRGRSRGRRSRRGKSRRGRRSGRRMRSHGNDDIDILSKEPLESSRPNIEGPGPDFERPRSRSHSRNSRSRSHTPTHSQSSLSSDREDVRGNPQTE